MSDDMWRECTDPDELAAAVAAQMRVEYEWGGEWRATWRATSDEFRRGLNDGYRYRAPRWWRLADEELVEALLGWCEDLRASEEKIASERDEAQEWADLLAQRIAPTSVIGEHTSANNPWQRALDYTPAPSPVPPWPGAVLSGLTDEDGVPTWLAQAGQVRGEQVRRFSTDRFAHFDLDDDAWVEVRAPRAAPEPETERVPWWEAKDRLGLAGDPFVEVGADDEGPWVRVVEGGTKLHSPVAPDGTVGVLKDGDR